MGIPVWISRDLPLPEVGRGSVSGLHNKKADFAAELLDTSNTNTKHTQVQSKQAQATKTQKGLQEASQLIKDLQGAPTKQIAELAAILDEPAAVEPTVAVKDLEGKDWAALADAVSQCKACDLHEKRQQTVFGKGNQQAGVMIVGDIPRLFDEQQGQPFTGEAGELLNSMLSHLGLESDAVYFTNLLKCRTPLDSSPQANQAASCLSYLKQQVKLLRPNLVLLLGRSTAQYALGQDQAMAQLRQKQHQIPGLDAQFITTYHPAYLLKQPRLKALVWQDLQFIKQVLSNNG